MAIPFGQTLLLWRHARGLTQAELARRAGVPRPNLSDIERGKREVSLGTLRALAAALDLRPGILADGVPPVSTAAQSSVSRAALERVADAVASGRRLRDRRERALAELIGQIHVTASPSPRRRRTGARAVRSAWLRLRAAYPSQVVQSLLQRVAERKRAQ